MAIRTGTVRGDARRATTMLKHLYACQSLQVPRPSCRSDISFVPVSYSSRPSTYDSSHNIPSTMPPNEHVIIVVDYCILVRTTAFRIHIACTKMPVEHYSVQRLVWTRRLRYCIRQGTGRERPITFHPLAKKCIDTVIQLIVTCAVFHWRRSRGHSHGMSTANSPRPAESAIKLPLGPKDWRHGVPLRPGQ
jgi:hypothetical protein